MSVDLVADAGALLERLFPICRSITGNGLRQTLQILRDISPFNLIEVPSGTVCYDWVIPEEWNVQDAYISDLSGKRIVDFKKNNLHLVNYSVPFDGEMAYKDLVHHLHTLPNLPNAVPYRTTYYERMWGFCLSHEQFQALDRTARYHVVVDTTLKPGSLTYGEVLLPGASGQEYLVSTYVCHPSMANDNLSGAVLWILLLRELRKQQLNNSYRFIIAPETIGALAYISRNEDAVRALQGGFVTTTVGGPGKFGYKRTFLGDSLIDRVVKQAFHDLDREYIEYPFDINGSDERQYSTPGLRVPVGTICKDKYYEYPFYHTSLDNLEFVSAANLVETLKVYLAAMDNLEHNCIYRSLNPIGEPMLGKRGLYPQTGGAIKQKAVSQVETGKHISMADDQSIQYGNELDAIRWILFYADGKTPLLDIAEKTDLPMRQLTEICGRLVTERLLEMVK